MTQHVDIIMSKLHSYINTQLNSLSQNNPLIAVAKPFLSRFIENNTYKVEFMLKQISDRNGMIDVDNLLTETIDSVINTKPFRIDTKFLGELEIGDGKIKMQLPLMNKDLILTQQDLEHLKDVISGKDTNI